MKILAPDNRKPVEVKLRLDAAIYEIAQQYKEYRKEQGEHFATDSQLFVAVIFAFFTDGDPLFKRWRKTHPFKPLPSAPVKVEKKTKKANGVDLYPPTTPEPQSLGSGEK